MTHPLETKTAQELTKCRKFAQQAVDLINRTWHRRVVSRLVVRSEVDELRAGMAAAEKALQDESPKVALDRWDGVLRKAAGVLKDCRRKPFGKVAFRPRHQKRLAGWMEGFKEVSHRLKRLWKQKPKKNPCADLFDAEFYLRHAPESAGAMGDPLGHYLTEGWKQNRAPHCFFDVAWYLAQNPDVASAGLEPLAHFLKLGWRENRSPHPLFDVKWYLERYVDVARSGINPLLHYQRHGAAECRSPHPLFDIVWYRRKYAGDLAGVKDLPAYYLEFGWKRGHCPHPFFDPKSYLEANPEVKAAGTEPLTYFVTEGWRDRKGCDPRLFYPVLPGHLHDEHDYNHILMERRRWQRRSRLSPRLEERMVISIVVPVFRASWFLLEKVIQSVARQTYHGWELILVNDGSDQTALAENLQRWALTEPRIRVIECAENGGISAATNYGLKVATGGWVAFLDHDDELAPDALEEVIHYLAEHPETDAVYTDQDKIDEAGHTFEPFHKPDWSPVYFLGLMYVGHLLVVRRTILDQVRGLDSDYDNVQDFEMMLRVSELTQRIGHIPKILYHWRTTEGSVAASPASKANVERRQIAAIAAHLKRRGISSVVPESIEPHAHQVRLLPAPGNAQPLVSIIIPCCENSPYVMSCLSSILKLSTYENLEILLVVRKGPWTCDIIEKALQLPKVRLVEYDFPFCYSRVNNFAAERAQGELLLFLNDDTEVVTPSWLQTMVAHLSLPGVGAVGAKLLYPDGTVQHAGVALGIRGTADHVSRGVMGVDSGYFGSVSVSREVAAVTGACLMVQAGLCKKVGGLGDAYASIYQDVDFCLKIRELGLAVLYVANAELIHHESATRGSDYDYIDRAIFMDRWQEQLADDPYYNINFSRNSHDYTPKNGDVATACLAAV